MTNPNLNTEDSDNEMKTELAIGLIESHHEQHIINVTMYSKFKITKSILKSLKDKISEKETMRKRIKKTLGI